MLAAGAATLFTTILESFELNERSILSEAEFTVACNLDINVL